MGHGHPLRAPADAGARRLAPDRPGGARRAGPRRVPRPPPRQRHLRHRAEDRPAADADVLQRRHAAPRDGPGQPDPRAHRHIRPARGWRADWQVSPEARLVRVKRLRLADDAADGDGGAAHPGGPRPGAHEVRPRGPLLLRAAARRGTESSIASGTQSIEPTVTSEEESEVLGVPLHTPAFLFERTTVSESGRIVEFVRSIYRGDRYRLVADLTPQRSRNGRSAGASRAPRRRQEARRAKARAAFKSEGELTQMNPRKLFVDRHRSGDSRWSRRRVDRPRTGDQPGRPDRDADGLAHERQRAAERRRRGQRRLQGEVPERDRQRRDPAVVGRRHQARHRASPAALRPT